MIHYKKLDIIYRYLIFHRFHSKYYEITVNLESQSYNIIFLKKKILRLYLKKSLRKSK